jgi:predicted dehydrogenase
MVNVGVIGLGMMGRTHLDIYAEMDNVQVVAVSDKDPKRLSGQEAAGGNIEGQAQGGFDLNQARHYAEGSQLIGDPDIELVDICVPTPLHLEVAREAFEAGKHVMVEKPLTRTPEQGKELSALAAKAKGLSMPAMCMRFWPGWTWLKQAVDEQRFGAVRGAVFRRLAEHAGGDFYCDGQSNGGALLDLHIHDTDFVQHLFGMPKAVTSFGYSKLTGATDHVLTHYDYGDGRLIAAEGAWCMAPGFGLNMQFEVNFEHATAAFDLAKDQPLRLIQDGQAMPIEIEPGLGYQYEIAYFIDCIEKGQKPTRVTMEEGANAVTICDAEQRSIDHGQRVTI